MTDARTIVSVERLLGEGAVFSSELHDDKYTVVVQLPSGASGTGYGDSFPEAWRQAVALLPEEL